MEQDRLVFALKSADDYIHVGTAEAVLAHYDPLRVAETGPTGLAQLEFYDADGARLVIDRSGTAPVLDHAPVDTQAPPDGPQLLVDRIALVLARAQVAFGRSANPALAQARVPRLDAPLPVVVAALAEWFQPLPPFDVPGGPTPGGPWHVAAHAAGIAHLFG